MDCDASIKLSLNAPLFWCLLFLFCNFLLFFFFFTINAVVVNVFPLGLTNIITVDLHSKEIQGFYDAPVDNLRASPFLVQFITDKVFKTVTESVNVDSSAFER